MEKYGIDQKAIDALIRRGISESDAREKVASMNPDGLAKLQAELDSDASSTKVSKLLRNLEEE